MVLLVEGGLSAIQQVRQSCENRTPIIVCHGTGKAADLLAQALSKYKDSYAPLRPTCRVKGSDDINVRDPAEFRTWLEAEMYRQLVTNANWYTQEALGQFLDDVLFICQHQDSVYEPCHFEQLP